MKRLIMAVIAALVSCGLTPPSVKAQDSVLGELYGQGVHAYFAGDYVAAHELFTNAIEKGYRDPRCYLFRGLTYARTGRPNEAEADFRQGAELEMTSDDRFYAVSDSLQRIQGKLRMQIERHRQSARIATMGKTKRVEQARFDELKRAEQDVLRDPSQMPAAPGAVAAPAREKSDPFAEDNIQPEKAPERKAPASAIPTAPDPFSPAPPKTAPAPAGKAVIDDPFGAQPATGKPAGKADPFGAPPTPAKPGLDPFGAPTTTKPAVEADPFGTPSAKPKASTADPFGAPAASKPGLDPFGAPPAPKPGLADPFGAPAAPKPGLADPFGAPAAPKPGLADPFGDTKP